MKEVCETQVRFDNDKICSALSILLYWSQILMHVQQALVRSLNMSACISLSSPLPPFQVIALISDFRLNTGPTRMVLPLNDSDLGLR